VIEYEETAESALDWTGVGSWCML